MNDDTDHKFYTDWHDLRDDGSVVLYKRPDRKHPKFIARLKIPGHSKYIVRSTKLAELSEARRVAERMFYEFESRVLNDLPISSYTFEKLFKEFEPRYVAQHQDTKHSRFYITENMNLIRRHFLEFARTKLVTEINERFIEDYFTWRYQRGKARPTGSTYHHERTVLNHIFRFAVREGYMKLQSTIKIPSSKSVPRPDVSLKDYRKIIRSMKKDLESAPDQRIYRSRLYCHNYILVLANTGIRKGEMRDVRWKDISPAKDVHGTSTVIIDVSGKTGARLVVANPSTAEYLKRIFEFRTEELGCKPPKDELVFCKPNGQSIGEMKKPFERLLDVTDTLFVDGQKRTIYSLRHTYITMRLSQGTPIYFLAMNCGTGVEMIEKFYGKKRVADPKIISQITQMSFLPKEVDSDLSFLS
jgi:integrase